MLRQLVKWFTAHPDLATTQFELFFWNLRNNPAMATKIYTVSVESDQASHRKRSLAPGWTRPG